MQLTHHRAGSGEPLVLIHGIGSRWQIWEPVLPFLTAHRDVIAIDLPGFGASPMPPPGTPAGPQSLTTLVAEFLEELDLSRPHVAGNSLGGFISLELARRGQVRSATALSPAGFANRPEAWRGHTTLAVGVRVARLIAPRAEAMLKPKSARKVVLGRLVGHPTRMPPADAAANIRALADAPWFDATLPTLGPHEFKRGKAMDVPVTIAWADTDKVLMPRQAKRAARAIPNARLTTLHDCGHVPTYDDPEQVARVLLEGSLSEQPAGS